MLVLDGNACSLLETCQDVIECAFAIYAMILEVLCNTGTVKFSRIFSTCSHCQGKAVRTFRMPEYPCLPSDSSLAEDCSARFLPLLFSSEDLQSPTGAISDDSAKEHEEQNTFLK